MDIRSVECLWKGAVEAGTMIKETSLYLAKRGSDGITSSFVAMRTNLLPSRRLTDAVGEMESVGFESVSLFTQNLSPLFCTEEGERGSSIRKLLVSDRVWSEWKGSAVLIPLHCVSTAVSTVTTAY